MLSACCQGLAVMGNVKVGQIVGGRDGILEEQKAYANREHREHRSMYGPYICQLPADMLAVITMHRLMGLLMSDQEHGCVTVIHAAVVIGEAVEQEVYICVCSVL
jgi:DNA-directed RNA polymerase